MYIKYEATAGFKNSNRVVWPVDSLTVSSRRYGYISQCLALIIRSKIH